MKLSTALRRQLEDGALEPDERARRRIELSRQFEEAGAFEAARESLGDLWQGIGVRPQVEELREPSTIA